MTTVIPITGEAGRFHVQSSGNADLLYLVDLEELGSGWCGCPHFEYRSGLQLSPVIECKHITAARLFAAQSMRERV